MQTTPDNTIVLHWDEYQTAWMELPWREWVKFRGVGDGGNSLLAGAHAGEHYFLVCVLGERGDLANVIPHRYLLSTDGRLVHDFDGLGEAEREEYYGVRSIQLLTVEESERHTELGARGFSVNLPPLHTVQHLARTMPGLASVRQDAASWHFLSAVGICRSGTLAN